MYARWSTLGIRTSEKPHNVNFGEILPRRPVNRNSGRQNAPLPVHGAFPHHGPGKATCASADALQRRGSAVGLALAGRYSSVTMQPSRTSVPGSSRFTSGRPTKSGPVPFRPGSAGKRRAAAVPVGGRPAPSMMSMSRASCRGGLPVLRAPGRTVDLHRHPLAVARDSTSSSARSGRSRGTAAPCRRPRGR